MSGIIDSGTMPRALVVLGAGGTVGTGVVEAALDSGHAVVAVGMDAAARHALLAGRPHAWLTAIEGAIGSDADAAVLALRLRALHVRIDGVIASLAGVHPCGRLMDEPADVLQRTLDQDLLPHLFAARHLLPLLVDDSAGYVLVGGPGGRYPWAGYGHCSIAAAALRMMARVLHDEAGRQGQRVQLLSMDAPLGAKASTEAVALGHRALAMLEAARRSCPAPIVDYAASPASGVIASAAASTASSPAKRQRAHAASPADMLPARDLRAARALLGAIEFPTSPGSLHDEHC